MKILGIDPGYAIMGYGIIETVAGRLQVCGYGAVTTDSRMEMPERLVQLYSGLLDIIRAYEPDALAIEELFFNTNSKTALQVGQARGVAILAGANAGLDIFEYTPLQVKQGVVGYGRADKKQIQCMVKTILKLEAAPKPDDTADALAVAICHAHSYRHEARLKD